MQHTTRVEERGQTNVGVQNLIVQEQDVYTYDDLDLDLELGSFDFESYLQTIEF